MRSVVWWSIGLLCGLGFMALGLFGSGEPSDTVLCGSEKMQPGQTCDTTQYGQTSSETYEEKRQEAIDDAADFKGGGRWVTFGIGTAIAGACGWRLVIAIRRRARQGAAPVAAAQALPGPQPGFAPHGFPAGQDFQQPGFQQQSGVQQAGFQPQPGFEQQPGFQPQPGAQQAGFQPQPGFEQQPAFRQQQPGFPPPQGFQQAPPPGYGPRQQ